MNPGTVRSSDDICFLPAVEMARLIRERELSPVDLVRAVLDRIARLQPVLNAYTVVDADGALASARKAEAAVMAGETLGPLHGVPFSVKDMIPVAGLRVTYGSYMFEHNVADADAVAVQRMKAAGAIVIGMTAMGEFGHKGFNDSPLWGVTRNPWDRSKTTGGSSGGAAASVASGMGPLALGTDYAGSVRIPAACCGIVGLKATLGAVPNEHSAEAFGSIMHIGPMARTVADIALTMSAIMGPDPADPFSYAASGAERIAAAAQPRDQRGIRCAWMPKVGNAGLDPDVATATRVAVEDLQRSGAVIDEIECDLRQSADLIFAITPPVFYALYGPKLDRYRDRLDPTCRAVIEAGKDAKAEAYQQALMQRTALFRRVQVLFDTYDFLLMPTLSAPALSADHKAFDELTIGNVASGSPRYAWYPYTHPFNLTGHPAISLPVGWSSHGLPIGLQIVGRWHAEERLLGVAASLEAMRPWADRRPQL